MSAPHMPIMNDEGVLECPLCTATISHVDKCADGFVVECYECGCRTGNYRTLDGAIEQWNTRAGHLYTPEDYKQAGQERDL